MAPPPPPADSLEAHLHGVDGAAAQDVRAVATSVLVPLQDPPGVGETSDLDPAVTPGPQLLPDAVHVHQDAHAAGADGGQARGLTRGWEWGGLTLAGRS